MLHILIERVNLLLFLVVIVAVLAAFCSFELFFVNVLVRVTCVISMKDLCRDFNFGIILVNAVSEPTT